MIPRRPSNGLLYQHLEILDSLIHIGPTKWVCPYLKDGVCPMKLVCPCLRGQGW